MTEVKKATAKTTKAATNDAMASVETMTGAARDQFENMNAMFQDNAEAMRQNAEDMMATCRTNMETATERFQAVGADMMSAARDDAAEAVEFMTDLSRAKTVADALEIQRDYWTNLFETRVERTQKMTKATVEAARDSFEPISKSMAAFTPMTSMTSFEKMFPFAAK